MKRDELNERFELSALDPFSDPAKGDAFVRGVMERSALELARRRRSASDALRGGNGSVLSILAGWARPALAAAAIAAAVSGVALQMAREEAAADAGVIEALALPTTVESWLVEDRAPTTSDLILTMEEGTPW